MAKTKPQKQNAGGLCRCCCYFVNRRMKNKNQSNSIPRTPSKVPFCAEIPKVLKLGDVICVRGCVPQTSVRFSVNLTCGKGAAADIAFHFNPRLDQNYVVRNCRLAGHWGEEETTSIVKCNFVRNEKFEIAIFIAKDEFMVSSNGTHFCAFGFRVPVSTVTSIEVHGQVEVYGVEYKEWKIYPQSSIVGDTPFIVKTEDEDNSQEQQKIVIPCTGYLPKGFPVGWQLAIYGRVKLLPHSFYVNLQEGSQLWPHPIIPLHLNPRFSTAVGENVFVRNAWVDGRWGAEERAPGFQFSPGSPFSMVIRRGVDHFSVWVDGQLTGEFKFRSDVDKIDTVYIQGDVIIKTIFMNEKTTDLYNNLRNAKANKL